MLHLGMAAPRCGQQCENSSTSSRARVCVHESRVCECTYLCARKPLFSVYGVCAWRSRRDAGTPYGSLCLLMHYSASVKTGLNIHVVIKDTLTHSH